MQKRIIIDMENIIGTKTALKILSCLLQNPRKEFKEIELIKESDVGKGAGADAINRLASSGIIKIKRVGRTKIVMLNVKNPVTFALRLLFDRYKFLSLPDGKISAVLLFKEKAYIRSKAIILFGSLASGTYDETSDIDLLVIADDDEEITNAKKEISELIGESLNIHLIKSFDIRKEFEENDLVRNALMNGIIISGDDYVREIIMHPVDLKELKFLKERIDAARRNYANKDYETAEQIISSISEDLAFYICKLEGVEALSRKDAISKIKKINEYKVLSYVKKLKIGDMLEILEELYMKLFNKTILKGEGVERRIEA